MIPHARLRSFYIKTRQHTTLEHFLEHLLREIISVLVYQSGNHVEHIFAVSNRS